MVQKNHFSTSIFKYIVPVGFIVIILLMITTSYISVSRMESSSYLLVESINHYNKQTTTLRRMSQAIFNRSRILIEMIYEEDPFTLDEMHINFEIEATSFIQARDEFIKKELDTMLLTMLEEQRKISLKSVPLQRKVISLINNGERQQAVKLFSAEALPRLKEILIILETISKNQELSAQSSYKTLKDRIRKTFYTMVVFDLISIVIGIILTLLISAQQNKSESKLTALAKTDALTNLANKMNLVEQIDKSIMQNPSSHFAIAFFDIDHFKSINDSFGHELGDIVLQKFADKILSIINKKDILARFGGDEFVLILKSMSSDEAAHRLIELISSELDTTFKIGANEIYISSSIGVSLYPKDARTSKLLLKYADTAMYTAKESGRNCFELYSEATNRKLEIQHNICQALHSILNSDNIKNELSLKYQPLLNVNKEGEEVTECEALIRWTTSEGEVISADKFIPLAEKNNLIEKINFFVIDEVCKQQREWLDSGVFNVRININLSGNKAIFKRQLSHFIKKIDELDLKPSQFGIELTERTLYEVLDKTIAELEKVRDLGMKISIDDFGTGYSSLSYLKKLPITTLKIDREFITGLPDDKDDQALVKAIITLGHSLNLDIVAEGVETLEQLEFLKNSSCNSIQGYYFHRPLESKQLSKLKNFA